MEAKIRKIRNQPLYEVKLYVRTLKEARATVAMHAMTGGMTGGILSLRQAYQRNVAMGATPAQALNSYLNSLRDMHGTFENALRQFQQDFPGPIPYPTLQTLAEYYPQEANV